MIIFPAIDLYEGKAVRLYKGEYSQMTVYSENPEEIALDFAKCGASHIHIVDLEGARDGSTPNLETVVKIKKAGNAFCEIGGGIRSMEVIDRYIDAGLDRVILGTAAVNDKDFLCKACAKYKEKIAARRSSRSGRIWLRSVAVSLIPAPSLLFAADNEEGAALPRLYTR